MHRYSIVVFLGAFLLFQVQPLIARVILPWFGGTAAVWNTCMMFFQIVLLLGYLYSHGLRMMLKPATSWIVHCVVLLLALVALPVLPSESLKPQHYSSLSLEIVKVLAFSVGLPFFVLATTGPLIQAWQSVSHGGSDSGEGKSSPYRLYALSNIGSLLALVSYPFLFEPNLRLQTQSWLWSGLFLLFVIACIYSGSQVRVFDSWQSTTNDNVAKEETVDAKIGPGRMILWLLLAMIPSMMLLATTNLMCQEIASVPFLWILPLALYLISFIICFEKPSWYHRGIFVPLLLLGVIAGVGVALVNVYASASLQVALLSFSLFACGMTCHGELERLKPHPSRLTLFYLFVSLGGSLGGIFVVLIAPRIFNGFPEFQLALIGSLLLGIAIPCFGRKVSYPMKYVIGFAGVVVGGIALTSLMATMDRQDNGRVLVDGRNEYGIFSVERSENRRIFVSGKIDHGSQIYYPEPSLQPHSYYADGSGFAISLKTQRDLAELETPSRKGIRVGVLGLGIGSMLSWAEADDRFTFYEINPQVEKIARQWFTFLPTFDAQCEVVIGDGRIMLENETASGLDREFDLLAIDAFSSDSIPIHLLTDECFDVYQNHLKEDGILLFHVSNRFIDLKPVLFAAAKAKGLSATYIVRNSTDPHDLESLWILMSNAKVAGQDRIGEQAIEYELPENALRWTDDFASLAPVIDWSFGVEWERMLQKARQNAERQSPEEK